MMVYGHLCLYASAAAVLWPNTMLWRHGVLAIVKALNEGGIAFDLSICFIGLPWHYVGSFHCFIPDSLIHFNGLRSTDLRAPSFINAFNRSLTVLVSIIASLQVTSGERRHAAELRQARILPKDVPFL
jgi:hypothetical protein